MNEKFLTKFTSVWIKYCRLVLSIGLCLTGTILLLLAGNELSQTTNIPNCVYSVDESLLDIDSKSATESSALNSWGYIQVEITGAIVSPGVYKLKYLSRLFDLIEMAGGFTQEADKEYISEQINLASKLEDETKITIPFKQEKNLKKLINEYCKQQKMVNEQSESHELEKDDGCISINSGNTMELLQIPGVGEKRAAEIIQNRPFSNIDELLTIDGVGETSFNKWKDLICL